MGDLKTQNTSYPTSVDTATLINDSEDALATHVNGPVSAILAIEAELGASLKGTAASLAARLGINLASDGALLSGTSFPVSPPLKTHLFYRTDTETLYVYNVVTANYDNVSTSTTLANYVRKDVADTITARHTFNPSIVGSPFIIGANAVDQKVTNMDVDSVDGYDLNQGVQTTDSPSFVTVTGTTSLKTDTIAEKTTTAGVTVDGCLIKDGYAAGANTLTDTNHVINVRVVAIGAWNMDTTGSVTVNVGISWDKIVGITGSIRSDDNSSFYPIGYSQILTGGEYPVISFLLTQTGSNVGIQRAAGSNFDDPAFSSTGISRGWMTIIHIN